MEYGYTEYTEIFYNRQRIQKSKEKRIKVDRKMAEPLLRMKLRAKILTEI